MAHHSQITDQYLEQRMFRFRLMLVAAACLVVICILIGRLVYLQVLSHAHFEMLSQNNRVRLQPVAPTRGLIFDRNGEVLAENLPSYKLEITPEEIKNLDDTLKRLGGLIALRPIDLERFNKLRRRRNGFEAIPLAFNLSDAEVAAFAVNKHHFPGVNITAGLTRHYPYGASAVHVLGYVGRIDENDLDNKNEANYKGTTHIGKLGIEQFYEDSLHGQVGVRHVEVNVEGRELQELNEQPAVPGDNLYLTLDINLQLTAEKALGKYNGAVVAIEPSSGEVLALVSRPTYDPHLFVNGISNEDYRQLRNGRTRPLYDRALKGQYPPGSTLKPFIGLAALESGFINSNNEVRCKGYYMLPNDDRRYRDWKKEGHGKTDLHHAIAHSCDVFFYDLAYRLGIDRLHDGLQQFGFGKKTGIDIYGEKSGLIPSRAWKRRARNQVWFPGETLSAGLGQGYMLTTPLQLAVATATLANGGQRQTPHLLKATEHGDTLEKQGSIFPAATTMSIKNNQNWQYIKDAMEAVVHGKTGTARGIGYSARYRIAGKTGTAQVIGIAQDTEYNEEEIAEWHRDHALFIAYAPIENPKIAVLVLAENGGGGSRTAAPIARKVLDAYLLKSIKKGKH